MKLDCFDSQYMTSYGFYPDNKISARIRLVKKRFTYAAKHYEFFLLKRITG